MKQKSKYRIIELVGRGQFGKVFAAIERRTGALLALKELNKKQLSTSDFLRELHFLVSLNHANIVACKALEHYQNNRYLILDYCEGGTLRDLLNNSSQLTLEHSLKIIIDILAGLKFAHEKGIIHRDIKPENILLKIKDRQWTAHLSDFGIAKLYQEINPQLNMGDTGSPAYMAPEQFYGQYSYSCDLYAVGVILFELTVGERPFVGTPQDLMSAHLNQPVTIPKNVPFMVRSAIAKSLQKLPHRRFTDAGEMLESLQLAQDVLKAVPGTIALQESNHQIEQLDLLSRETLLQPVTKIAIASNQVYLGTGDRLYIYSYQNANLSGKVIHQWEITLDAPISQLEIRPQGCFITTLSSIYYLPTDTTTEQLNFLCKTFLPIISLPTNDLVSTIEPQGHWIAASYPLQRLDTTSWEIWQLPDCQLKRSLVNEQRWNFMIALDRRYGLAISSKNQDRTTELQLFNRRGNWLAHFDVQFQLNSVIYNPLFPNQLLAIEVDNPGIATLITLKGFKIQRISLESDPSLIAPCHKGYLLSDRQGRITLINGEDFDTSQFQIPLSAESITAFATTETHLLVATASSFEANLDSLAWS